MSNLLDTLITIAIVAALILGARAYQTGDLAAWAFDNFPAIAMAIYPENAPGAAEARQAALERMASDAAHTVADKAVDVVADVADAVIPGAGEAVENAASWVLPDLPSTASLPALPSAASVVDTVQDMAAEVIFDDTTDLIGAEAVQPTPTPTPWPTPTPHVVTQAELAQRYQKVADAKQAMPTPTPRHVSARYSADAWVGLCAHAKAVGLQVATVTVCYPDGVQSQFTIYPNRVESQPNAGTCQTAGFSISFDSKTQGTWAWSDSYALVGMANKISAWHGSNAIQPIINVNTPAGVEAAYSYFSPGEFLGLCSHVRASGVDYATVDITYPDGKRAQYVVYAGRIESRPNAPGCWKGTGICLSAGGNKGYWTLNDNHVMRGMAQMLDSL